LGKEATLSETTDWGLREFLIYRSLVGQEGIGTEERSKKIKLVTLFGDDTKKRKVLELADAWRKKDASQVRSLLQGLAAQ